MSINVREYKISLDGGKRDVILRAAAIVLNEASVVKLPALAVTDGRREDFDKTFGSNALAFTKHADDFNAGTSSANDIRNALALNYQEMEHADACLNELDRIAKGDKFGAGRGFDTVGEPPYVARIEKTLAEILAKLA